MKTYFCEPHFVEYSVYKWYKQTLKRHVAPPFISSYYFFDGKCFFGQTHITRISFLYLILIVAYKKSRRKKLIYSIKWEKQRHVYVHSNQITRYLLV